MFHIIHLLNIGEGRKEIQYSPASSHALHQYMHIWKAQITKELLVN